MRRACIALILTALLAGGASASAPWRVSPKGVGPVHVGMTTAQAFAAVKPSRILQAPGAVEDCDEYRVYAAQPFHFLTEKDRVVRVSVTDPGLRTAQGVGVGDTVEAVRRAYGARLIKQPAPYDDAPAHDLVFWTSPGRGLRFEIGQDGKVILIHAGGQAIQYVEGCL